MLLILDPRLDTLKQKENANVRLDSLYSCCRRRLAARIELRGSWLRAMLEKSGRKNDSNTRLLQVLPIQV